MTERRFLLDTNVLSEPQKKTADSKVVAWIESLQTAQILISAISIGEILYGIRLLPFQSARRLELQGWLDQLREQHRGRIVSPTLEVTDEWSAMRAKCHRAGFQLPIADGLLAATADTHGCIVATRDVDDFKPTGVRIYDPWTDTFHNMP